MDGRKEGAGQTQAQEDPVVVEPGRVRARGVRAHFQGEGDDSDRDEKEEEGADTGGDRERRGPELLTRCGVRQRVAHDFPPIFTESADAPVAVLSGVKPAARRSWAEGCAARSSA